jgi:hypothetical protein
MKFHLPTMRLALTAALFAMVSMIASAWSLWGPTLPPAPGIVKEIEKEVALSKGENAEFEECKERFRSRIKSNYGAAASAADNDAELILYNVVSVYMNDATVNPLTCRIKSVLITQRLRDIDNNGFYAIRDILMAVRRLNLEDHETGEYTSELDDKELRFAYKVDHDMLACAPTGDEPIRIEAENIIVYCQFAEPKYSAITYGLIFKSEIGK